MDSFPNLEGRDDSGQLIGQAERAVASLRTWTERHQALIDQHEQYAQDIAAAAARQRPAGRSRRRSRHSGSSSWRCMPMPRTRRRVAGRSKACSTNCSAYSTSPTGRVLAGTRADRRRVQLRHRRLHPGGPLAAGADRPRAPGRLQAEDLPQGQERARSLHQRERLHQRRLCGSTAPPRRSLLWKVATSWRCWTSESPDELLQRKKRHANETGECYFPASRML